MGLQKHEIPFATLLSGHSIYDELMKCTNAVEFDQQYICIVVRVFIETIGFVLTTMDAHGAGSCAPKD